MPLTADVPGRGRLEIEYVVFDVNGTLTDRGRLLDGVAAAIERLKTSAEPLLASADTFGTLAEIGHDLGVGTRTVRTGADKRQLVAELGADRTAVVGNGTNDTAALAAAVLGIAVLGPEGMSTEAMRAAAVVCRSAVEAIELLLDPTALIATLRA